MVSVSCAYAKRRHIAAPNAWTAVLAPIDANFVNFRNAGAADGNAAHASAIVMRSEEDDQETEDTLAAGAQESLTVPFGLFAPGGLRSSRFTRGDCVLYVQSANDWSQLLVVTWAT